ncbi:nitroreductase family protein [Bacteroidales bacterium]|nr:nitroreductase family protein [Bacteroidales bacterium]
MLKDLVIRNRSYRRFKESVAIEETELLSFVDMARVTASTMNKQSLKYFTSNKVEINEEIFSCLNWAGYLKDWDGPEQGERPSAYIVILNDLFIYDKPMCDYGIAAQTILLAAVEAGYGGCIIGSIDKNKLSDKLGLPGFLDVHLVVALGKPCEEVKLVEMKDTADVKYYRNEQGTHFVPKRPLSEIVVKGNK